MTKFTLLDLLRQDSNAKTEFNVLSNMTKPTLLKSLCQEPEFLENTLSNANKPELLESLSQESVSLKIGNHLLSNTTKPYTYIA